VAALLFYARNTRHPPGAIKKTAQSWRVSGARSALTHEPAQTTKAGKTKQKPNLKQKTLCKLNNQ
jgi:hypothetical protein